MHIERTGPIDPSPPPGGKTPSRKPESAPATGETPAVTPAAAPEAAAQSYVRRAIEAGEVRSDRVAEARRLIAEGRLDTPDAARRAAENLLDRGI